MNNTQISIIIPAYNVEKYLNFGIFVYREKIIRLKLIAKVLGIPFVINSIVK